MKENKNIQPEQEATFNQEEDKLDKENNKTEADSYKENTNDGYLKPTKKISENIHTKPAEEQQFENKE